MVREVKVNILGEEYLVKVGKREEIKIGSEYDGLCYTFDKILYIVEDKEDIKTAEGEVENLSEIIAHEVSHAYVYESGYSASDDEEALVVWLSRNARKITNTVIEILDNLGII